jgi:hypothetical protein
MKIEFNKEQFLELLEDSPVFRHIVFDLLNAKQIGNVLEYYAEELRKRFPYGGSSEKIAAIKWLREEVRDEKHLDAFAEAGYDVYIPSLGSKRILGLAGAKQFVERNCKA